MPLYVCTICLLPGDVLKTSCAECTWTKQGKGVNSLNLNFMFARVQMNKFTACHKYFLLPHSRLSFFCHRTKLWDDHFYHFHFSFLRNPANARKTMIHLIFLCRTHFSATRNHSITPSQRRLCFPPPVKYTFQHKSTAGEQPHMHFLLQSPSLTVTDMGEKMSFQLFIACYVLSVHYSKLNFAVNTV